MNKKIDRPIFFFLAIEHLDVCVCVGMTVFRHVREMNFVEKLMGTWSPQGQLTGSVTYGRGALMDVKAI